MTPHNNPEWQVITPMVLEKVGKYDLIQNQVF